MEDSLNLQLPPSSLSSSSMFSSSHDVKLKKDTSRYGSREPNHVFSLSSGCTTAITTTFKPDCKIMKRTNMFLVLLTTMTYLLLISTRTTIPNESNPLHQQLRRSLTTTSIMLFSDGRHLQKEENTTTCTIDCCKANYEEEICTPVEEDGGWIAAVPVAIQIILVIVLLSLSAIFSGLTLGLMSLDITGLEIVMAGDDPVQAQYAKNIYPIRKKGNLLLCTLLLGNVSVNSLLSIFMAAFTDGIIGFLTSTIMIVIFGEILPQAFVRQLQKQV